MKTSPELLNDILGVLGQINSKIGGSQQKQGAQSPKTDSTKSATGGFNLKDFSASKKDHNEVKDTAESMKILSSAIGPLADGLKKFGKLPKSFKKSIIYFLHDFLQQADFRGASAVKKAKTVAEAMKILGDALPELAKGILYFGMMAKMGLVAATSAGIEALMKTMSVVGKIAANPYVLLGVAALAGLGVALQGIASVMQSVALVMLSFAASVAMMVGTLWLASKLFGVGPMEAMLIVMGSLGIVALGFVAIGLLSGPILAAGTAVSAMGVGLLLAGAGLLVFMGSFALMNLMSGGQEATDAALWSGAKALGIMGLVFAGLGLFGGLIKKGGIAVQEMGKGLLWASGGILAMGGVALLCNLMGVNMSEAAWSMGKSLLILGGTFALLGLISPVIILGVASIVAISIGVILFSLVSLGVGAVINKLGGEKGLKTMSSNITLLVSGVLIGVINGISQGLLGENGDSKGFFGKIFTVGKNIMILVGGIILLMLVSYALIMFATSLYAFQKVGIIKDAKGNDINVVDTAENIAKSIGSFFKTLTGLFKDKNIIPDEEQMATITRVLLGKNTGFKLLGIRIIGSQQPGLIDAIAKFGQLLVLFAKVGEIPLYEVDSKGNAKKVGFVKTGDIATKIVSSLKEFFVAFKTEGKALEGLSADVGVNISTILLGSKWTGASGFIGKAVGVLKDQPGLLEPIMKFSEMLQSFATTGADGKIATSFDKDGKPNGWQPANTLAHNIAKGLISFLTSFNAVMSGTVGSNQLAAIAKTLPSSMGLLTQSMSVFNDMGKNLSGVDKLSISLGNLADNIGRLSTNMSTLNTTNLDKLATSAGSFETKYPNAGTTQAPAAATWGNQQQAQGADLEMLAQKIADKINSSKNGTFDFIFHDTNRGKIEVVFK